jgi:hypothetical protein
MGGMISDWCPNRPDARIDMLCWCLDGFTWMVILLLRVAMRRAPQRLGAVVDVDDVEQLRCIGKDAY